jgi:hypothetical protein
VSGDGTVGGLQATVAAVLEKNVATQASLAVAKARNQEAAELLKRGTVGSSRDETASAKAALTAVEEIVDQAIEATIIVSEQLAGWSGSL